MSISFKRLAVVAVVALAFVPGIAQAESYAADSDLKPATIPIKIRPSFRFEAGHDSNQRPAGFRL
ncbi:hypothetical protein [Ensifer adhaerens]|uniref:hypothetical protein n=1 Tax=Ensifer adhaerens TaxID=106592 RepID=UPI0013312250|nr:hypothetical protein [Ensifer adhaerens]